MESCRRVRRVKKLDAKASARLLMTSLPEARSEGRQPSLVPAVRYRVKIRSLTARSYVAALELRIEKLERRLEYARSRKASVALHDNEAPAQDVDRKDSLATIRAAIHRKAARIRENSDVNSLVSDSGFL